MLYANKTAEGSEIVAYSPTVSVFILLQTGLNCKVQVEYYYKTKMAASALNIAVVGSC